MGAHRQAWAGSGLQKGAYVRSWAGQATSVRSAASIASCYTEFGAGAGCKSGKGYTSIQSYYRIQVAV